jgi:hypothetical protein
MILGLSTATFTVLHVVVSLFAILAGTVVVARMLGGRSAPRWTALYLAATLFTSASGFFFQSSGVMPSHVFGVLSLIVLAPAVAGLYVFRLAGPWRWIYIVGALIAFYLNVFVAVVQAFQKLPALQPLAPTQSEPPFLATQLVVLVLFVALGVVAVRRFHPMRRLPA